ncbi:MAG TPA: hypothetical protein PLM89_11260, partial [Anaerolineales bacterium]|nr:hypothetical protein [Anaerolineales bacterium]
LMVLLAQAAMDWLSEVFRLGVEPLLEGETRAKRQIRRNNLLYVSLACIVVFALTAYILFVNKTLPTSAFYFLALSLFIIFVYSIPPFRLANRGMGELLLAAHLAYVSPAIAFTLQAGETHRFLILSLPLTLLAFSCFIALGFETFARDRALDRVTFLTRLGWERAAALHPLLIVFAYLAFMLTSLFGVAFSVIWPVFLTLPFAVLEVVLLRNVSLGAKPNWKLLRASALTVFGLAVYFLMFTLWLR